MSKWLLALQHWQGDREEASRLVDLIVELEQTSRTDVEFAIIARHDTKVDEAALAKIRTRMPAAGHVIPSGLVGYPGGCNSLWRETVLYAASRGFDYVLTFEADCTPLVPNWVDRLRTAVEEAVANKHPNAVVFGAKQGAWVERRVFGNHINGNCVVRLTPKLVEAVRKYVPSGNTRQPWDLVLYDTFERLGGTVDLREIRSDWRSRYISKATAEKWIETGVAFHHGCRDYSLARQVRRIHDVGFPVGRSGVFTTEYPDAVPTSVKQADLIGGKFFRFPSPGYNCAEYRDLRAVRVPGANGMDSIWIKWGDHERWITDGTASLEDPRVWVDDGVAHVLVAAYLDRKEGKCRQRIYRFRRDDAGETFEDLSHGKHPIEKNWLPVTESGSTQYLYAIHPDRWVWRREPGHHVDVRPAAAAIQAGQEWVARYGEMRGSTPPILLPDKRNRLVFFHSHVCDPVFGRRYALGAAVLSSRSNGYRTLRMSKRPLHIGSAADGFSGRIQNIDWPALVFFAGSAELLGDTVVLAGGLNDCWSAQMHLPLDRVLREMSSG